MALISSQSQLPLLARALAATHPLSICVDLSIPAFRMNGIMQRGPFWSAFLHLANVTKFVPLPHNRVFRSLTNAQGQDWPGMVLRKAPSSGLYLTLTS